MRRRNWIAGLAAVGLLPKRGFADTTPRLKVVLNKSNPRESSGLLKGEKFAVGFGKHGFKSEGSAFEGGYSLLGTFRVNAILTRETFAMTDSLAPTGSWRGHTRVERSGVANGQPSIAEGRDS